MKLNFSLNLRIGKLSKNNIDLTLNLAGTGCSKKSLHYLVPSLYILLSFENQGFFKTDQNHMNKIEKPHEMVS